MILGDVNLRTTLEKEFNTLENLEAGIASGNNSRYGSVVIIRYSVKQKFLLK